MIRCFVQRTLAPFTACFLLLVREYSTATYRGLMASIMFLPMYCGMSWYVYIRVLWVSQWTRILPLLTNEFDALQKKGSTQSCTFTKNINPVTILSSTRTIRMNSEIC